MYIDRSTVTKPWRPDSSNLNASLYGPNFELKPSLNSEKRRRELNRINYENNKLLSRLQNKKSNYNVIKWEKEREQKEKLLKNICTYPHILGTRHRSVPKKRLVNIKQSANTTQMNFNRGLKLPNPKGMNSIGDDSAEDNMTTQSHQDALNRTNYPNKGYPLPLNSPKERKRIRPLGTEGTKISQQRILLFEKKAKIGAKEYLVEISRDKLHMFIIAFLLENPKYFTMQVPIKQAFKLLLELDNSFDTLVSLLYFNYNTLLLPDFIRTKFSPRFLSDMSISRTTSNKESSKYHGFDGHADSKINISEGGSNLGQGEKQGLEEGKEGVGQDIGMREGKGEVEYTEPEEFDK